VRAGQWFGSGVNVSVQHTSKDANVWDVVGYTTDDNGATNDLLMLFVITCQESFAGPNPANECFQFAKETLSDLTACVLSLQVGGNSLQYTNLAGRSATASLTLTRNPASLGSHTDVDHSFESFEEPHVSNGASFPPKVTNAFCYLTLSLPFPP
jgi:hypothetical protein